MKNILIVSLLFLSIVSEAQEINFVNSNSALLLLNPSFAGTSGGTRIQTCALTRNILQNFRSAQMQTSVDHFFANANAGLGCSVSMVKFNFFSQTDASLNWAQHIQLSNNRIKLIPSIIVGMRRVTIDPSFFSSSIQPPPRFTQTSALMGASVLLEIYERLYVGVVIRDINVLTDLNVSSTRFLTPISKSFHLSYNLQLSNRDLLQAVLRFTNSSGFGRTQIGANYLHKAWLFGAGITAYDASYLQFGYKTAQLTASLQGELVTSRLAGNFSPSFGINLAATIRNSHANPVWKSIETW